MRRILVCTAWVGCLGGCAAHPEDVSPQEAATELVVAGYLPWRQGQDLSAEGADALEQRVYDAPEDLASRTQLLGYYFKTRVGPGGGDSSIGAAEAAERHALWVVENAPWSETATFAEHAIESGDARRQAAALWAQHLRTHREAPRVLTNAASFFTLSDGPRAVGVLEAGARLEPDNSRWDRERGHVLSLQLRELQGEDHRAISLQSLAAYEDALAHSPQEQDHFNQLGAVAEAALKAGRMDAAKWYAQELLQMADKFVTGWNYGRAIHDGNEILGEVAMARGDVEEAKRRLLAAGDSPGGPALSSFGPRFTLARSLLEHGERDTVLQYLAKVRRFWRHHAVVDRWSREIRAGKVANIRAFTFE